MQPEDARSAPKGVASGTAEARDERLAAAGSPPSTASAADALRRAIAKATTRIARRVTAIEGDLAQADLAEAAGNRARLFVAEAARAPRGTTKLQAVDWSAGAAQPIEMALDPARSAKEQLDAVFRRARRMKEGRAVATRRLTQARATIEALEAITIELAEAGDEVDLATLEARATATAPRDVRLSPPVAAGAKRRSRQEPLPPYRLFTSVDGLPILVGRGAAHNDELTLHVARPRDLWLHAKGLPGAHVVVRLAKGATISADALVDAAHLAAHFSDARGESVVEVTYVPRRYVRKPRGSPQGAVAVDREKVIVLRRQEPVLRRLLDGERGGGRV
jgi:predicted ribosome quality control (RQC) complex YloA/Tae2 family protein